MSLVGFPVAEVFFARKLCAHSYTCCSHYLFRPSPRSSSPPCTASRPCAPAFLGFRPGEYLCRGKGRSSTRLRICRRSQTSELLQFSPRPYHSRPSPRSSTLPHIPPRSHNEAPLDHAACRHYSSPYTSPLTHTQTPLRHFSRRRSTPRCTCRHWRSSALPDLPFCRPASRPRRRRRWGRCSGLRVSEMCLSRPSCRPATRPRTSFRPGTCKPLLSL